MPFLNFVISFIMFLPIHSFLIVDNENEILGKWISIEKNLIIEVYKQQNDFRAKVIWFRYDEEDNRNMKALKDHKNPNLYLRNRKVLGMDILENLTYNPESSRWEDGLIYDPLSGRYWSSVVYFNKKNQMEVKGYWKFEFISKSITFNRVDK